MSGMGREDSTAARLIIRSQRLELASMLSNAQPRFPQLKLKVCPHLRACRGRAPNRSAGQAQQQAATGCSCGVGRTKSNK